MKAPSKITLISGVGISGAMALLCLLSLGIERRRSQSRIHELTPSGTTETRIRNEKEEQLWQSRIKRLHTIWTARHKRNIFPDLITLAQDTDPLIRRKAVQALGEYENPSAEPFLQELAGQRENLQTTLSAEKTVSRQTSAAGFGLKAVPLTTVRLALARIQTRHLKGTDRIEALAKSVGLSLDELSLLSQKVNDPVQHAMLVKSPGFDIVDTVVDVLALMAARGEDITPVATPLKLSPVQQQKLQSNYLPAS